MKLLFCRECFDLVRLTHEEERTCACGASSGKYIDHINAWYKGDAVPVGLSNRSFLNALLEQPNEGMGKEFTAFVIPKECPTFENRTDDESNE